MAIFSGEIEEDSLTIVLGSKERDNNFISQLVLNWRLHFDNDSF